MSGETNGQVMVVPKSGEVARQSFGATEMERRGETASSAMAAQARAAIEARYVIAMQRPRDLMVARAKLLEDCRRPFFAEKAIYNKPIGDGVEGPSIRLAEAAARAMGNVFTDVFAIYDDASKRIVRVVASDLEANLTFTKDVTIHKTVERRNLRDGQVALGQRINSRGKPVFIVEATDDEILDRENALASKAMRTCLLRLVPGDILEEAMEQARATMRNATAKDPSAAKKAMCDAFGQIGVSVAQIAEYLGHQVEETTPDEIVQMRSLYAAIKDGETKWSEAMENRGNRREAAAEGKKEEPPATETKPADTKPAEPPKGQQGLANLAAAAKEKRTRGMKVEIDGKVVEVDGEGNPVPEGGKAE